MTYQDKAIWERWISPEILARQVENTAGFLFPLPETGLSRLVAPGADPRAFLRIIGQARKFRASVRNPSEELQDYFALCLAAHHATVATFVPTDVDTKIRGHLWRETHDPAVLRPMADLVLLAKAWDLAGISTRYVIVDEDGPVSGHNGEMMSVLAGALGRFLELGESDYADRMADAIDSELQREARVFARALSDPELPIETLKLAMSIAHNLGDIDQGISFWKKSAAANAMRARFGRLGHENAKAYAGIFQKAMHLYRDVLAAEGHRHYPLRAVQALRRSADLLLPLGPFFDDWGRQVASHPALSVDERAETLAALASGCRKVPNQMGYYRAIAGFASASGYDRVVALLPSAAAKELRSSEFRKLIAVPQKSYESMMGKRVAAVRRTPGR
jgi:hypothetical protein